MNSSKTQSAPTVHRIDATRVPLGRLATKVATLLRGKHKPTFVFHLDIGDAVIITNAQNVALTGQKLLQKAYYHHTGYLGHLKTRRAKDLMVTKPDEVIRLAVAGMLPKNRLRKHWLKRLTIFGGEEGVTHGR